MYRPLINSMQSAGCFNIQFEPVYNLIFRSDFEHSDLELKNRDAKLFFRTSAIKSKVKNLHGDMRLFKNENYTDFYTEPPVLSLEDVLYVEVNMERPLVSDIDSSSNVSSNSSNHEKIPFLLAQNF